MLPHPDDLPPERITEGVRETAPPRQDGGLPAITAAPDPVAAAKGQGDTNGIPCGDELAAVLAWLAA